MQRLLIALLAASLMLSPAAAQNPPAPRRIGILGVAGEQQGAVAGFQRQILELAKLAGFEEGRHFTLHWRSDGGDPSRLPELAREFLQPPRMDLIIAIGNPAVAAAKAATAADPIPVLMAADDPMAAGLVASLAKPGDNLTGVSLHASAVDSKRLEVLTEALPGARRIAYLVDPFNAAYRIRNVEEAAAKLQVELVVVRVATRGDFDAAFRTMQERKVEAALLSTGPLVLQNIRDLAARAAAARLPTMCATKVMTQAGCLFSFGPNPEWAFGRLTDQLVRILAFGASPAELPVEEPTKFDLIVNLKTAAALGIAVPPITLARAQEVLE